MTTLRTPRTYGVTSATLVELPACARSAIPHGRREYGSLIISAVSHMTILLGMALCVIPTTVSHHVVLEAVFNADEGREFNEFELGDEFVLRIPVEPEMSASAAETRFETSLLEIAPFRSALPADEELQPVAPSAEPTQVPASSSVSSAADAIDHITQNIERRLREGDLLVVWLLDASNSLVDDRHRIATRLESYLRRFAGKAGSHNQLLTSVASFGDGVKEYVKPTAYVDTISDSIRRLPVDESGKENVFAAVEQCVTTYRKDWHDAQLMVVVWTDESGDDTHKLEDTIAQCTDQRASIIVVGPSAVLGADSGMRYLRDPGSQQTRHVSVTRGPDSPLPERLELGYWFLTQEPPAVLDSTSGFAPRDLPAWYGTNAPDVLGHQCIAATEMALPAWYGGPDLKGLVSGFSPYALTRLATQTGGSYVTLDREDERSPFRAEAMRAYLPDYRSMNEYLHEVHSQPLRHAVVEAARVTQNNTIGPPPVMLFGQYSEKPPYGFMRAYFPPRQFSRILGMSLRRLKTQAARTSEAVEQALVHTGDPSTVERGLEREYQREKSLRWRAWYDLTRGRLLAASVRLEEYRLTCDMLAAPGFLYEKTNHLIFAPSTALTSGSKFHRRAEEAERLLTRCVRENPNSPWAWLAQRELDYGLGIDVQQHTLARVVMPPSKARRSPIREL